MLGINWRNLTKAATITLLMLLLTLSPIATAPALAAWGKRAMREADTPIAKSGKLSEVAPPAALQELQPAFDDNKPQVSITRPRPNEVLTDDTVSVQFQVRDLTLFKDQNLGLGPHLHVFLDNQPYQAVYDSSKPLVLEKLAPGTHTIRAFASRPWHESFKNEGAYAQTTFHVFTQTGDNSPDSNLPLLTYSRPQASYGAEPIMLDFYLTNAPLHLVAREDERDDIADWRIRCTVNGDSFVLDQWQPIYLKGFKPGKNWVQLQFLDEQGEPVKNVFNNTARLITYEPDGQDSLSKLVRGDISGAEAQSIVDPNYTASVPVPAPAPAPVPTPTPSPIAAPSPTPPPVAQPAPSPIPVAPVVKATPSPAPSVTPTPGTRSPNPRSPEVEPAKPEPLPSPKVVPGQPKLKATPPVISAPVVSPPVISAPVTSKVEPSPDAIEAATGEAAIVPQPDSQPQAEKFSIEDFLNRFRRAPNSTVSAPSVNPGSDQNPGSEPQDTVSKSTIPEPVEIAPQLVPEPEPVEHPEPVETLKPEDSARPASRLSPS